ncbi:hypothetical protein BX616_006879 [Lobosporangium transversale]|nr:hypothetical protein BX616_006879 [Lobosporangium transversale]
MSTVEPTNLPLTPPPESGSIYTSINSTMDSDTYPTLQTSSVPLKDSASVTKLDVPAHDLQGNSPAVDRVDEHETTDEDTITTTTFTTSLSSKELKSHKGGMKDLLAQHQSLHQKILEDKNREIDHQQSTQGTRAIPDDGENITTNISTIQAPSATSTLSEGQSSSFRPSSSHHDSHSALSAERYGLPTSTSTSSIASVRSNTSPGNSSSAEGYHSISTTSVTRKKRQVRRPTFEARSSRLDPETMSKNQDPFRGFHTLFWIVMGAYGLITFDEEWTRVGRAFGGTLFSSFSQDAIMLAISDFGLVFSTGIAFVLIKVIAKGWMRYRVAGMVIQHCVQASDWPWVQSGFFTLHAITMLMKIHSYIAYNGDLSEKLLQLKQNEAAYALIKKRDPELIDDISKSNSGNCEFPNNHSSNDSSPDNSSTDSLIREQKKGANRRRHHRRASEAAAALLHDPSTHTTAANASLLAADIEELKGELRCQNGELWPANVTVANFLDYLIVPSLIYELQYPRTDRIRPMYVFEKSVATLGTFTLLYLTTEHYIYPVVFDPAISPLRALVLLMIPFMMNYLMIFYIIFECICNAFAELSRFADRNFYEDWWNCTSFDEWARKWNKPVHHFLLRHVYDSSIESFHLSKSKAAIATFFLSSCVHELVMMVVTRKVRLYLFVLQMFQLPLIWMGNHKAIREKPRLANAFFWLGMFCGPPLLGVAYCYA